jgi:hypothetical protein
LRGPPVLGFARRFFLCSHGRSPEKAIQKVVQPFLGLSRFLGLMGSSPRTVGWASRYHWQDYGAFAPPKRINPLRTSLDPIIPCPTGSSDR